MGAWRKLFRCGRVALLDSDEEGKIPDAINPAPWSNWISDRGTASRGIRIVDTRRPSIDEFTGLQLAGIDSLDILTLNYFAARGLPGTENSNLDHWLAKRDAWANYSQLFIRRHLPLFDPRSTEQPTPGTYGNSLARFFCWYTLRALCNCGLQYHPDRRDAPDTAETPDIFVHGLMDDGGKGGTCASLPVIFVSVGRCIGLPLYLVATRKHMFFRYDDPNGTTIRWRNPDLTVSIPPDRFNVSGSGDGLSFDDDAFYREWPLPWRDLEYRNPHNLRSMSRKEELAAFLMQRGECFWNLGQWDETMKAYYYARQLVPDNDLYNVVHANTSRLYLEQQAIKQEIVAEINQAQRRIPGAAGDSPNGEYGESHHLGSQRERVVSAPGHSPSCECDACRQLRSQQPVIRPHGPSCQCFHCKQADQKNVGRVMTGHSPSCQCAACRPQLNPAPAGSPLVNGIPQRNTRGLPSP